MVLVALAVASCVWWLVLRVTPAGIIPAAVYRVWFGLTLVATMLGAGASCFVIHQACRLLGVPVQRKEDYCVGCGAVWYRYCLLFFNPQVRTVLDESEAKWSDSPPGAAMVANHLSNFDPFLCTAMGPLATIATSRSYFKGSLANLPVFHWYFKGCGHFPVFFTSKKDGDFSTDKEKQARTAEIAEKHFSRMSPRGRLAMFPEGAVNKNPDDGVQACRIGGMNAILKHKMPVTVICFAGQEVTWGAKHPMGGPPTLIVGKMKTFAVGDYDTETATGLADRLRKTLQEGYEEAKQLRADILAGRKKAN